ncbi:GNAT family N-acetyltransferase [Vagococcus elongatus]|uniref:GNAT family N-acetyltransferase n=1 Tax=Vagococcus elongatus TaxID=180344 RepID=UPI001FE4801C|nr:GNAT family N-acetyltransferase [Vagococcus elongatus]
MDYIVEEIRYKDINDEHYRLLLEADPSREKVESYLKQGNIYAAKIKQKLAGIMVLIPKGAKIIEIVNLSVSQEFRQKGIGTNLLQKALTLAKEKGYKTIEIGTGSTSFQQLYMYQKNGFRMESIDRNFFVKQYDQEIIENGLVLKDMVRLSQNL